MSINDHIWIEKKWIKQQAELLLNCSYDLFDLKMDKWPWTLSVIYLWPQLLPSIQFKIKRAKKRPIKNKNQFNLVAYEIHFFSYNIVIFQASVSMTTEQVRCGGSTLTWRCWCSSSSTVTCPPPGRRCYTTYWPGRGTSSWSNGSVLCQ